MVHDGRATKAHRALVTISAWCGGDDMIGRLSNSDRSIMTTGAGASCLGVIDETHLPPRRREVAAFAEICRLRVALLLAGRRRTVVAGETLPRRPLETSADVARCAVDARMRAREGKSRQEMIEGRGRCGLGMAIRRDEHDCRGNDQ